MKMVRNLPLQRVDPYFLAGIAAALVVAGVVAKRAHSQPRPSSDLPESFPALVSWLDTQGFGRTLGDTAAPVHVIEFSDYECPACALAFERNHRLMSEVTQRGDVSWTVYELPLRGHPFAISAAVAASCVARQDAGLYWRYRGELFTNQAAWSLAASPDSALVALGRDVLADPIELAACVSKESERDSIRFSAAVDRIIAAGVRSTPFLVVSDRAVAWEALEDELERSR